MSKNTGSEFILIVDDNPIDLSVLSEVLSDAGLSFRVAMDGESALALAGRNQPELILLDVKMPGIDGFETCRRLKENPDTQSIPVIFTTATTDAISKVEGFAFGAVDYIAKPFQKQEVLARVKVHLRLHHLNRHLQQELELRQQIENQLRQNEQRYRSLYEGTPVMLHSIDATGKLVSVSNYWLAKLGYERNEVLGRESIEFLTEASRRYAIEVALPAFFRTGVCEDIPYQMVSKTGEIIDILLSATADRDESGQIAHSLCVIIDVTERNRAQAELIQAEKMVALGRLISGITHELRNPLNFIKNYAEGSVELSQDLLDTLQPALQYLNPKTSVLIQSLIADLQENATTIRHNSKRAAQIIESMMQHPHADDEQALAQPTNLHDLLDRAVKLAYHSKQVPDSPFNLAIRTNYATDLGPVEVIPSSLIRAFINLIDNACDAMRFKRRQLQLVSLQAATDYKPTLSISTRSLGKQVEIRIRDNGYGIDSTIQSKVLDPFFTTKPLGEGTGLGLSLTHDIIVKQHQGKLTLDSKLGEFTEIILTLPNREHNPHLAM
ncbi:MAG: response regulator [Cyanobacteria bacterium P01_A01_bin.123]